MEGFAKSQIAALLKTGRIFFLATVFFAVAVSIACAHPGKSAKNNQTPDFRQLPLRHSPEKKSSARQVSAEKWSQMAAELLRIKELRNPKLAFECADKAIQINPGLPFAYLNRGSARMALENPKEAIKDYTQAIRLSPGLSEAYFNRAVAYESMNKFKDAAKDFSKVISLNSNDVQAYARRASAYFSLGKNSLACEDLKMACGLGQCAGLEHARKNNLCQKKKH